MPEETTAHSAEPESPLHSPKGNPLPAAGSARAVWTARFSADPPPATRPTRSLWKKILVPTALAVIGVGLLLGGFAMYPRRAQPPTPISAGVSIQGTSKYVSSHLALIEYTVDQVHPDIARLTIQLVLQLPQLPSRDLVARFRTPPRGAQAQIGISVPDRGTGGPIIIHCSPSCAIGGTFINNGSPHLQAETTADTAPYFTFDGTATAYFVVKAHSFGVASNGLTAEVAFPQISLTGTRRPTAILTYQIPSASSYDWSSVPTSLVPSNSRALWTEAVTPGNQLTSQTGIPPAAPVASGINHTAQTHDSTLTLIVGIMFGIGGSAIIAAVQEARHAAD